MMAASLEKSLFNLKFTAKQLNRQAQKAGKDENAERNKLKKVSHPPCTFTIACELTLISLQAITQGHADIAKIYAQNAIRKQNEKLNLLRLGSRIDAVASRYENMLDLGALSSLLMSSGSAGCRLQ